MLISDTLIKRAEACVRHLEFNKLKIAIIESCTGGLLSFLFTCIPGASRVLYCSMVTYANEAKTSLIGVPSETIAQHGAVSEETALAMVHGALSTIPSVDRAVAITGIAGSAINEKGLKENDDRVGTVYIGLAKKGGDSAHVKRFCFGNLTRVNIQSRAAWEAMNMVLSNAQ